MLPMEASPHAVIMREIIIYVHSPALVTRNYRSIESNFKNQPTIIQSNGPGASSGGLPQRRDAMHR